MKPAGPHSTPQGLFVTSGCRGRGDRLTGHHANITLPTWGEGRGWGSPATFGSLVSEWLVYLLGHLPKDPCCWPSHKLQGPLWERILLDFCFFTQFAPFFARLSRAWGLGFLFPILSVQPADRVLAAEEESGPTPNPSGGQPLIPARVHSPSHRFNDIR